MERAQLRYMKEEMMHQLLQRLSATYTMLSRRLGMASALQCLKLTEEEDEGGASTVLGLEERHLYQLAGDMSEVSTSLCDDEVVYYYQDTVHCSGKRRKKVCWWT